MTSGIRFIAGAVGKVRSETFQGRPHTVVPVVALVEGVVHAMNAKKPELVTAAEFSRAPMTWNGRPVFLGHPMVKGNPVSGNTPELIEEKSIGTVFNAGVKKNKLTMEAWIDDEKADLVAPTLLSRLRANEGVEISVGVFTETDDSEGVYNGVEYHGEWRDLHSDHLALLPEGDIGACSREMGCGVRAAKESDMDEDFKTLRNIPQKERDKMPAGDFAGPGRSFPIAEPEDVSAAAHSLGRAKGDQAAIKSKIISIAYRKGASFVAQLPNDWKRKKDQKSASVFVSLLQSFRDAISPTESDRDVRDGLLEALKAMEPAVYDIAAVYSDRVVYPIYESGSFCLYQRAYTGDEETGYKIDGNRVEVEAVTSYEPVDITAAAGKRNSAKDQGYIQQMHDSSVALGADCPPAPKAAAATETCGCGKVRSAHSQEADVEKQARIKVLISKGCFVEGDTKFLEAATDEQLARFEATADAHATALKAATDATSAANTEVTTLKAAQAPKPATFEEVLATADPATREMIAAGKAVGEAKKADSIKVLLGSKRCDLTEAELKAMTQVQLDQLVKLADIKPAVDFSGLGGARTDGDKPGAIAAPPDMNAAIKAARAGK